MDSAEKDCYLREFLPRLLAAEHADAGGHGYVGVQPVKLKAKLNRGSYTCGGSRWECVALSAKPCGPSVMWPLPSVRAVN